jgi:hypothetical protein
MPTVDKRARTGAVIRWGKPGIGAKARLHLGHVAAGEAQPARCSSSARGDVADKRCAEGAARDASLLRRASVRRRGIGAEHHPRLAPRALLVHTAATDCRVKGASHSLGSP